MSTLSEQLNRESKKRIQAFNDAHFEWLMRFENQFTHFITLTFHPMRIRHLVNRFSHSRMMSRADLLELEKKSVRYFGNRLDKSLYGNASARHGNMLLLVPVFEGLYEGGHTHCHGVMGIAQDRHEGIEAKVRDAWRHAPLAGSQIDVQPYRNSGCLGYMNKQSKYINRECIDWDNVRIPVRFPSIAE